MVEMTIYGVSFDLVGKQPIVLLKTADGNRYLPIWIGHPEAAAILMKLQGASRAPAAHARPAREHPRRARRRGRARHRHRAAREHLPRLDHRRAERRRARDRLALVGRDRSRRARTGADLRRRRGDRGVGDRDGGRRGQRGRGRRRVPALPRQGLAQRTSSRPRSKAISSTSRKTSRPKPTRTTDAGRYGASRLTSASSST